ncbi:flagellin [Metabacillus fastidiosus]|uniref:flagellin N-terminal helical domain-containing protein n=1 Tax=Metabacillus fastidiosus TaxID=1458 RepID=UPI002E1A492D|nr:flagellin [Metabacillus fastidiosus]MED4534079.1 flagellin [Metabacillus fastidiosus]
MKIHNQPAIAFSINRYERNATKMEKTIDKLATGLNIRKASDNAAGLAVSETLRAQVRGLSQAQRNMQDGLSALQVASEGLNNVNGLLQRARELAVMSTNGTLTDTDRQASQLELDQLMEGINDTAHKLEFNTKKILGENAPLILMIGANPGQQISIDLMDTSTAALGIDNANLLTSGASSNLITKLDKAILETTSNLTKVGSYYKAIEHHMKNALVKESNLTSSISKLTDLDTAKEMMQFVSLDIRQKGDQLLVVKVNQNTTDVLNIVSK